MRSDLNDRPAGCSPAGNRNAAYVLNITGSWEKAAYSPADLERLATLKRKCDPDNLLRHTKRVAA